MKFCYHCGKPLVDDAAYCVHCGKTIEVRPPDGQAKYCPYCGGIVDKEMDYCHSCGRKVAYAVTKRDENVKDTLGTVAKVFLVIACVATGLSAVACIIVASVLSFGSTRLIGDMANVNAIMWACGLFSLVSLAWRIPLTVHVFDHIKRGRPIGTAIKVFVLIAVELVAGILLLCRKDPK